MGTLVCFHAHPDDEAIATSGLMAKAKALGHRVVLVFATRGEHGEPVPDVLRDGEQLALRRTAESYEAGRVLGVDRVEFLGYIDSGMADSETSSEPWCFAMANVDHAAGRLALILGEERAAALTTYDDHGNYGHPDHIQVHRVGKRAAELIGLDQVYESTMNRTLIQESMGDAPVDDLPEGTEAPEFDETFGSSDEEITHVVDATGFVDLKRKAMLAHRSQIAPDHFLLSMPEELFTMGLGFEWYIASGPDAQPGSMAFELFGPRR